MAGRRSRRVVICGNTTSKRFVYAVIGYDGRYSSFFFVLVAVRILNTTTQTPRYVGKPGRRYEERRFTNVCRIQCR